MASQPIDRPPVFLSPGFDAEISKSATHSRALSSQCNR